MEKEKSQQDVVKKYVNLLLSRYRLIAACTLLAVSAGFIFYLFTDKIYESSSSLIYQQQRINPSQFSPDDEKRMQEMVNTLSQQVLSRGNLEKLLQEYNLYQDSAEEVSAANLVSRARSNVDIKMERDRGNVFSVSFQSQDPMMAMQVTNWLASQFIEENLRSRQERAVETSDYIQDELRMAKKRLDQKETEMKEYKLRHYNEMPDQRASNMNRLDSLQQQFQDLQTNIYNLEQTRLLMSEQLAVSQNMQNETAGGGGNASAEDLSELRDRLQDLLGRYTAAHPEVKRLKKRIERLQTAMASAGQQPDQEASAAGTGPASLQDIRTNELAARIKEIDINLRTLRKESNNVLEEIETYKNYVEAAPVREAEWASLTRDYEELKQYHDQLLSRSFGAEAAETIEVRQKGSQFKIVDPAFLPKTPVQGRFLKILLLSVAIGLAAGGGMTLGLDFINTSFRDVADVESSLQLPVTCALPLIVTEAEQKSAKLRSIAWSSGLAVWLIALISAGVYLWQQGELIL